MGTAVILGPNDHLRPMTLQEYYAAAVSGWYHYELIEGKVYVSPKPTPAEAWVGTWLLRTMVKYSERRPRVINYVHWKHWVCIRGNDPVTMTIPDLVAYNDFPCDQIDSLDWRDVSPVLVGEVIAAGDPEKDLVRNVALYLQVPSIRQYWVLDRREGNACLRLHVYRRHGRRWRHTELGPGEQYSTRLLPNFELTVDPST